MMMMVIIITIIVITSITELHRRTTAVQRAPKTQIGHSVETRLEYRLVSEESKETPLHQSEKKTSLIRVAIGYLFQFVVTQHGPSAVEMRRVFLSLDTFAFFDQFYASSALTHFRSPSVPRVDAPDPTPVHRQRRAVGE
jgi:hypothetical protein